MSQYPGGGNSHQAVEWGIWDGTGFFGKLQDSLGDRHQQTLLFLLLLGGESPATGTCLEQLVGCTGFADGNDAG